jgi:hypothetical protein
MAVLGLAAPKRGLRRTENPRVGGSIPPLATTSNWSIPDTWVTVYTEHMGDTLAPKGFSALSSRHVS